LKKTRVFEGRALRRYKQQPYWQAVGSLRGGLKQGDRILSCSGKYCE
jgi:hypothetical protein